MPNRKHVSVVIADPAADQTFNLLKVPVGHQYTIEAAYAAVPDAQAATAGYADIYLVNGGVTGGGTAQIGSGGGSSDWVANVAKAIAVTDGSGKLTAGQWLNVEIDETSNGLGLPITIAIEYVDGIGANANA